MPKLRQPNTNRKLCLEFMFFTMFSCLHAFQGLWSSGILYMLSIAVLIEMATLSV